MQQFVADITPFGADSKFVVAVKSLKLPPAVLGHVDKGKLVRRGGIVTFIPLFVLLDNHAMAAG